MNDDLPIDFDETVYLALNPDVAAAGVEPAAHYLSYGMKEGRKYQFDTTLGFNTYLSQFSAAKPTDQSAIDLFDGLWSTSFNGICTGGHFDAAVDARIFWLIENLQSIDGFSVLELGPLEGGHTIALEKAGADVLAVEANYGAFLRCLVIKNIKRLRAKFLLGDFLKLDTSEMRIDLIVASGVLYHMKNPVAMLEKFCECTSRLFLWTHYFEPDLSLWNSALRQEMDRGKWECGNVLERDFKGQRIRFVKQNYLESKNAKDFCGGTADHSYWLYKEDLLGLLGALGFGKVTVGFDNVEHQNGPSMAVLAER